MQRLAAILFEYGDFMMGAIGVPFLIASAFIDNYSVKAGCVLVGYLSVWGFAFQRIRKHKLELDSQSTAYAQERERHGQEICALDTRLQSTEKKVLELQSQIDNRSRQKRLADTLASYHTRLVFRRRAIEALEYWKYVQQCEVAFNEGEFEPELRSIIGEVEFFLTQETEYAALAKFRDSTNMKSTPVEQIGGLQSRLNYWQRVLDVSGHRANKLMEIIDGYTASQSL